MSEDSNKRDKLGNQKADKQSASNKNLKKFDK